MDVRNGEVPLEIFGRNDARYSARKPEKKAYYIDRYGVRNGGVEMRQGENAKEGLPPFPAAEVRPGVAKYFVNQMPS